MYLEPESTSLLAEDFQLINWNFQPHERRLSPESDDSVNIIGALKTISLKCSQSEPTEATE